MVPFFNHHHKLRKRESLPTNQTQTLDGKVRAGSCCKEVAPQKKKAFKIMPGREEPAHELLDI